jgi:molybdopterin synthase catalytic subunit
MAWRMIRKSNTLDPRSDKTTGIYPIQSRQTACIYERKSRPCGPNCLTNSSIRYMIDIRLTNDPLSIQDTRTWLDAPDTGGTCVFVGTVRNKTSDKSVVALEFEAYKPMAIREMRKIAEEAVKRWPVLHIAMHHRLGELQIGEIPVIIAVSTAHRDASFEACKYCIDTLKETVPIWKKEVFEDGEVWVAAHP